MLGSGGRTGQAREECSVEEEAPEQPQSHTLISKWYDGWSFESQLVADMFPVVRQIYEDDSK
jgi:hypothetical protein